MPLCKDAESMAIKVANILRNATKNSLLILDLNIELTHNLFTNGMQRLYTR